MASPFGMHNSQPDYTYVTQINITLNSHTLTDAHLEERVLNLVTPADLMTLTIDNTSKPKRWDGG